MKYLKNKSATVTTYFKILLKPVVVMIIVNFLFIIVQFVYLNLRLRVLKTEIPIWYTMPWGTLQLGNKSSLNIIPLMEVVITVLGTLFVVFSRKKYMRYGGGVVSSIITISNIVLSYSLFRIVQLTLTSTEPLIDPNYLGLIMPFIVSIGISIVIGPRFIEYAKEKGIVTDPANHKHPAMILVKPSARGGGIIFVISLLITSLIFVQLSKEILGTLIAATMLAVLGMADDYQNTHSRSGLKFLENPIIRLMFMFVFVAILIPFNIKINFVNNPFNGIYSITGIMSSVITLIWIVWLLNLLSWSNGVDGQYSGIIGVVGVVLALLALRFENITQFHENYARLAVITAGASLGILPYSWHPSKIMWGFGAISAGLVLSSLSILINAKITTSILILLIPFMDASVTIVRRIIQKKNPLKGDRGHLHHMLLDKGWKPQKVAMFYWITTIACGILALLSAEKQTVQTALALMGLVAFAIVSLNLKLLVRKHRSPKAE